MCLGVSSWLGYVKDQDVLAIAALADLADGENKEELEDSWDRIT